MRVFGKIAEVCAALALFILVVMTIAAVFMRYFWGQPIQWTEEMSGFLMIWVVMLGGVVAERDKAHLTIPFVVDGFSAKLRTAVEIVIACISVALLLYMAYLGYELAVMTEFKVTQILKISWYWIDLAVPIGAVATAIFTGYWLMKDLLKKDDGQENR
jgi:TRAP-type C4-dicarboxylate transport system permease small subunit